MPINMSIKICPSVPIFSKTLAMIPSRIKESPTLAKTGRVVLAIVTSPYHLITKFSGPLSKKVVKKIMQFSGVHHEKHCMNHTYYDAAKVLEIMKEMDPNHNISMKERIDNRWQVFQKNRSFTLFKVGRSDAELKEEFKKIQDTRESLWILGGFSFCAGIQENPNKFVPVALEISRSSDYQAAHHLAENDRVRANGCIAFAYNNTVPEYNASTILLNERIYIACQGPRIQDLSHFWNMLQVLSVTHIVRLTDAEEGGIPKCYPYWELGSHTSPEGKSYLKLSETQDNRLIRNFAISDWKDNSGVDPDQLLSLVLQVRGELQETNGLMVVHCSAGVGRTGTFLAALAIVDAIDKALPFSIEEIVYRLSLQRVNTVGRAGQYITLHRLAESYLRQKNLEEVH